MPWSGAVALARRWSPGQPGGLAARRRAQPAARHLEVRGQADQRAARRNRLGKSEASAAVDVTDRPAIPDRRLELMLVCAHPAIARERPDAADAAGRSSAWRPRRSPRRSPSRPQPWRSDWCGAKKRIRDTGILLRDARPRAPRRATARGPRGGLRGVRHRLAAGARRARRWNRCRPRRVHLALVLADLLPDEPEVLGLAALVCLVRSPAARAAGRRRLLSFRSKSRTSARWDLAHDRAVVRRCCSRALRPNTAPAGSSTRRRSSPPTAVALPMVRWTPRRCAPCIARWCGRRRR